MKIISISKKKKGVKSGYVRAQVSIKGLDGRHYTKHLDILKSEIK